MKQTLIQNYMLWECRMYLDGSINFDLSCSIRIIILLFFSPFWKDILRYKDTISWRTKCLRIHIMGKVAHTLTLLGLSWFLSLYFIRDWDLSWRVQAQAPEKSWFSKPEITARVKIYLGFLRAVPSYYSTFYHLCDSPARTTCYLPPDALILRDLHIVLLQFQTFWIQKWNALEW